MSRWTPSRDRIGSTDPSAGLDGADGAGPLARLGRLARFGRWRIAYRRRPVAAGTGEVSSRRWWVMAMAVLVPLSVLSWCQLHWLADLETSSAIARAKTLENLLGAVDQEIRLRILSDAQRALDVPARLFDAECQRDLERFFAQRVPPWAASMFALSEVDPFPGTVYRYDADAGTLRAALDDRDPATRAILMAASPRPGAPGSGDLAVDESDLAHRVIYRTVEGATGERIGTVGLVVAPRALEEGLLARAVRDALPTFSHTDGLVVTARDGAGRTFRIGPGGEAVLARRATPEAERRPAFLFGDWRFGLESRFDTPADWARTNFRIQVSLSAALAVVLAAGLFFALRGAARATALADMKSEFVSNVSHELRTPLASIRVFGELLRLGRFTAAADVGTVGNQIETEARRLSDLVDRILDFSRIESGQRPYRLVPTRPEAVLESVASAFAERARDEGREIEVRRSDGPLPAVAADTEALARALGNLVDNAFKYAPSGSPVRLALDGSGESVAFRVGDRGPGIPAAERERIFERFHRASTGHRHDVQGCGLGLAIVRHVVAAHRGRVGVEDRPGGGTDFVVTLPAVASTVSESPDPALEPGWAPGTP